MLRRLFKYYGWVGTATTIYNIIKPIYEELKKDADELEKQEAGKTTKDKRQTKKKNVINKKPKRSHTRKANPEGL
jgi:hypothetical protein